MKEKIIAKAVRASFRDVAFPFRMGAGFPGDVNRTHPVSIVAVSIALTLVPPLAYGIPVLIDAAAANNVRQFGAGDGAVTKPYGWSVRPYPQQQQTQTSVTNPAPFGSIAPPVNQPLDIMRMGYIMAQVPSDAAAVVKGAAVFVWVAASVGTHTQGGVETAASGGNTAALDARYTFDGPADANGVIEIAANW